MRCLSTLAIALAAGCHEAVTAPPEYEVHVASSDVWSGSEVRLVSDLFTHSDTLPTVTLDSIPLALRRVDDTTLAARLPDLAGEHRLTVTSPGVSITTTPDLVRLYGYRDRFEGPPLKGNLFAWPEESGQPMVLGAGPSGLIQYDLANRVVARSWPDSVYSPSCGFAGVGTTWRADAFFVQGIESPGSLCGAFRLWRLIPTPVLLPDSAPFFRDPSYWVTAEIAPHRWMFGDDTNILWADCRSTPCVYDMERWSYEAFKALISPRDDRVILIRSYQATVIDPDRLAIAWRYAGIRVWDAVFTAEGDTLFMVGSDSTGQEVLIAGWADDGRILAVVPLEGPDGTEFSPTAVALDPLAPWVYVAGEVIADTLRTAALAVVDHRTFTQVTVLQSDDRWKLPSPYGVLTIVPAPLFSTVFVVGSNLSYDPPSRPAPVYRYDRVP